MADSEALRVADVDHLGAVFAELAGLFGAMRWKVSLMSGYLCTGRPPDAGDSCGRGGGSGRRALFGAIAAQAFAAVDVQQGHPRAPDAAGVQGEQAGLVAVAFEGRPVAEDDLLTAGLARWEAEPGA